MLLVKARLIEKRIKKVAKQIARDYRNSTDLTILIALKGGVFFAVHLCELLESMGIFPKMEFIKVSRYTGDLQTGTLVIEEDDSDEKFKEKFLDQHVLGVDDIFDEGITLQTLNNRLEGIAKSIKFAVLVEKDRVRDHSIQIKMDYVAIPGIDQRFWLVGCGMDTDKFGRGQKDLLVKYDETVKSLLKSSKAT